MPKHEVASLWKNALQGDLLKLSYSEPGREMLKHIFTNIININISWFVAKSL